MRLVRSSVAAAILLCAAAAARPAAAQSSRPFGFGVSAGPTFLTGADRAFYNMGYNGQLSVLVPIPAAGFTLRADAVYLGVPGRNKSTQTYPGGPDTLLVGDLSLFGGVVSAVISPSAGSRALQPYLNFGGGVYRVESEGVLYGQSVSGADTKFGVLGGVGVSFPLRKTRGFLEARVHNVFTDGGSSRVYPISVGLLF
jgi:hypothetical protein